MTPEMQYRFAWISCNQARATIDRMAMITAGLTEITSVLAPDGQVLSFGNGIPFHPPMDIPLRIIK